VQVSSKRWKVDVNARVDAVLLLSAVALGGEQRRRGITDQLAMREHLKENDLVAAEVHSVLGDGSLSLQSRSTRFGRLVNGLSIWVPHALIKRLKQHYITLPCGVDVICGLNGCIWMQESIGELPVAGVGDMEAAIEEAIEEKRKAAANKMLTPASRQVLARVHNSIAVLREGFLCVSPETIMAVYRCSEEKGWAAKDMLTAEVQAMLQAEVTP
jgi:exosome complex component RRP4